MPETNLYLVPEGEPAPAPRNVRGRVVEHLLDAGIIAPPDAAAQERHWYRPGDRARDLLANAPADASAFEHLIIHDAPGARFIPDSHTDYGAHCPKCNGSLFDELHDILEEQAWAAPEVDMSTRAVTCPVCRSVLPLWDLPCSVETIMARFYLNLCAVPSRDVSPPQLRALEEIVGEKFRILEERL